MAQLIDNKTETTELVEQCQAKHASLRADMHALLLRLKVLSRYTSSFQKSI